MIRTLSLYGVALYNSLADADAQRAADDGEHAVGLVAHERQVLLKNDGALPFRTKRIALYGPGASMTIKGGTGSGEVNERRSVTILEGLTDRGFDIGTNSGSRTLNRASGMPRKPTARNG